MANRASHAYLFGEFRVDVANRLLYRNDHLIALPPKVVDTLLLLVTHHGKVLTKDEMIRHLWPDTFVEEGTLAQYIFLLRKALGDSAGLIENFPRRGYRFAAAVERVAETSGPEPSTASSAGTPEQRREGWFRISKITVACVGSLLLAALVWSTRTSPAAGSIKSLAVIPFRTAFDAEHEHVADGITESLIAKLANLPRIRVVSYSRVRQFRTSTAHASDIGKRLGVEAVIEGTVRVTAGRLRVSVHAIDASSGDTLWADGHFEADLSELLDLERKLANTVALRVTGEQTGTDHGQTRRAGASVPAAYELLLRARPMLLDSAAKQDREAAVRMLERAVHLNPEFADAYGWLAFAQHQAYALGGGPDQLRAAISNANQALSRDPQSLIAVRALTHIQHSTGREIEGLLLARRALEIYPDDLDAVAAAAEAYFRTGMCDRSIPLYEKALRWQQDNYVFRTQLGRIYFFLGDYAKGLDSVGPLLPERMPPLGMTFVLLLQAEAGDLDKAVQSVRAEWARVPRPVLTGFSPFIRGAVLEAAGDESGAREIWDETVRAGEELLTSAENPYTRYGVALASAKLGRRGEALQHLRRLLLADPHHPVHLFFASEIHSILGDRTEALLSLRAAIDNGFFNLPMIEGMARSRICTLYSLREDREFLEIRRELARRVDDLRARF